MLPFPHLTLSTGGIRAEWLCMCLAKPVEVMKEGDCIIKIPTMLDLWMSLGATVNMEITIHR